jgi:fucose permease
MNPRRLGLISILAGIMLALIGLVLAIAIPGMQAWFPVFLIVGLFLEGLGIRFRRNSNLPR